MKSWWGMLRLSEAPEEIVDKERGVKGKIPASPPFGSNRFSSGGDED